MDISVENIELPIIEELDVYKPKPLVREGTMDGEKYSVLIKERELVDGTPPSKAESINLIEWDEAFYLEWAPGAGVAEAYEVEVLDSSDNRVALVEDLTDLSVRFQDFEGSFPQNGEKYEFIITTLFVGQSISADPVTGTAENKTPQNLSYNKSESKLSWDTVVGDVLRYEIIFEDGNGNILFIEKSDISEYSLSISIGFYSIYIRAVSKKELFKSDNSTAVTVYISEIIDDLEANVVGSDLSLTWSHIDDRDGYNLYMKEPSGSFSKVNNSLITANSYSKTLSPVIDGEYEFYVIPVKNGIEGRESDHTTEEVVVIEGSWSESEGTSQSNIVFNASPIDVNWNETDGTSETVGNP